MEVVSPVTDGYGLDGNELNSEVSWVKIELRKDAGDTDHYVDPE